MSQFATILPTEKLNITSNTIGGVYRSGISSLEISCNFTYNKMVHNLVKSTWKLNGKYAVGSNFVTHLTHSYNTGSSILVYHRPLKAEAAKIEVEITYTVGDSVKQNISVTKTGFVSIAG